MTPRNLTVVVTNDRAVEGGDGDGDGDFVIPGFPGGLGARQNNGDTPLVTMTIAQSVDARTCVVEWDPVNVPAGNYSLIAFDTGAGASAEGSASSAQSPTFSVIAGTNMSCISANLNGAVPSPTADTGSGGAAHHLSSGALGGIIAAVVVAILGLIAAFALPRICRRDATTGRLVMPWNRRRNQRPGAPYYLF